MHDTRIDTPKKARIKGAFEFLQAKGLSFNKPDLFDYFGVSHAAGDRILSEESCRTQDYHPSMSGKKRRRAVRPKDLGDKNDDDGLTTSHPPSAEESRVAGISSRANGSESTARNLYNQLSTKIANEKGAEDIRRLEVSKTALSRRPSPEDWHNVIFLHQYELCGIGKGPPRSPEDHRGQINPASVQEGSSGEKDEQGLFFCAAMGYDIKSPLLWYEMPSNCNSEMSQAIHKSRILQPSIEKWIRKGYYVALEVDGNDANKPANDNLACQVKEKHGAEHFVNYPPIQDLSPIESFLAVPNAYLSKSPSCDMDILKDLLDEGWRQLSQETINEWAEAIPQRLHHNIDMGGT